MNVSLGVFILSLEAQACMPRVNLATIPGTRTTATALNELAQGEKKKALPPPPPLTLMVGLDPMLWQFSSISVVV